MLYIFSVLIIRRFHQSGATVAKEIFQHSRFFTLTLTKETTDQKKIFFLLCRVKKRDVTGQLIFLFWKLNDLHVWKLSNFNQKFIIKEIFIQLSKLFMVSLDFERFFIRIFTHDVTVFSRQSIGNLFFYKTSMYFSISECVLTNLFLHLI